MNFVISSLTFACCPSSSQTSMSNPKHAPDIFSLLLGLGVEAKSHQQVHQDFNRRGSTVQYTTLHTYCLHHFQNKTEKFVVSLFCFLINSTLLIPNDCIVESIGRGSSHNIEVGPWFSKSVPCTQHSWTKKSSIKVQEDARDDIDCIH